jgi:regulator of protease activity HflC (stomatin/prohibitin superfamily)
MGKLVLAAAILVASVVAWKTLRGFTDRAGARPFSSYGVAALAGGVITSSLIILFSSLIVVPAGHVGVVSLFGKVQPRPLYEGLHIIAPWYDVEEMSTQVKKKAGKFDAASKDLQTVHVEMAINYRLNPERAPEVYRSVGKGFADVIITPAEQEVLKAHTALYNASDILHQRPKLKSEVQSDLAAWLLRYGIELREASLANITFDPTYARAIESKQVEEQNAEKKRYEVIQAVRNAEVAAANAKGKADSAREEAKGEADALRFKGQAQAEYNQKVSASLTPTLITQQWIEAWRAGAAVPQFIGGGAGQNFLLQMPPLGATKPAEK